MLRSRLASCASKEARDSLSPSWLVVWGGELSEGGDWIWFTINGLWDKLGRKSRKSVSTHSELARSQRVLACFNQLTCTFSHLGPHLGVIFKPTPLTCAIFSFVHAHYLTRMMSGHEFSSTTLAIGYAFTSFNKEKLQNAGGGISHCKGQSRLQPLYSAEFFY